MICILGGTFDPVHFGHLRPALDVQQALEIPCVQLIPCRVPPHRDPPQGSPEQRLKLLRLAVEDEPALHIDTRELGRDGPSYMVDTLKSLRAEIGEESLCLALGLDALLGLGAEQVAIEEANGDQLKVIPVDLIQRGKYQPRMDISSESLEDLAESIKHQGIVQPVVIRPLGETGRYELIAGERRFRAAKELKYDTIEVILMDVESEEQMMILSLIENIQREDLNAVEEGKAYQNIMKKMNLMRI